MKKAALFVGGLLLSALACAPAMAEVVRVKVTARVTQVEDSGGALNNKIVYGTRVTGTYVYNTNTPDYSTDPMFGRYRPYANEARMRFVAGGLVFESNQPTQGIEILVGPSSFEMTSMDNKPLSNGGFVNNIAVRLYGASGGTQTKALPTQAPDLTQYMYQKDVSIVGSAPNGASFIVSAQLETAELIVADTVQVSPAAGSFLPNQHFDAALTLPRNSNVVNVIAKASGAPLPIGYPGFCTLVPPNSAGQPAVLCPNADAVLPQAAGAPIEWTVELSNGTILTETANWTLQQ